MCGVIKLNRIWSHYINGNLEVMDNIKKTREMDIGGFGVLRDEIMTKQIGNIRGNRVKYVDQEKIDEGYQERYEGM